MRCLDWAGVSASGIPAWLNSDAQSQIAPPATLPGNFVSQRTLLFSNYRLAAMFS
jgi:hypothetical protein